MAKSEAKFEVGVTSCGIYIMLPETKHTHAACFSLGWSLTSRPGVFLPHWVAFKLSGDLRCYQRHFRWPFNVTRVG